MRIEKFSDQMQSAIADAQSLALGSNHTEIEPAHLLSTLLESNSSPVSSVIARAGGRPDVLRQGVQRLLEQLPEVSGGSQEIRVSAGFQKLLATADVAARSSDEPTISADRVLITLSEDPSLARLFAEAGVRPVRMGATILRSSTAAVAGAVELVRWRDGLISS